MNGMTASNTAILQIKNLTTAFRLITHSLTAVDRISFELYEQEILAIVGESGCGKSVTTLSILNLIEPPGSIAGESEVLLEGKNLLALGESEIAAVRGKDIAIVMQEPAASFNPLFSIGYQIAESLRIHRGVKKEDAFGQAVRLLDDVAIPEPEKRVHDFPFQLSGGMLQRTMIALALSCSPKILLADEPTTALDVTIQAQILELLKEKAFSNCMSVLFVTHDLEIIAGFADRVIIMYAGRILEESPAGEIYADPKHPYTQDLLDAVPKMGYFKDEKTLHTIEGSVPELHRLPPGCKYAPRCKHCFDKCGRVEPALFQVGSHKVRCWLHVAACEERAV